MKERKKNEWNRMESSTFVVTQTFLSLFLLGVIMGAEEERSKRESRVLKPGFGCYRQFLKSECRMRMPGWKLQLRVNGVCQ